MHRKTPERKRERERERERERDVGYSPHVFADWAEEGKEKRKNQRNVRCHAVRTYVCLSV